MEEYQKMFRSYLQEDDYEVLDIEGSIPVDLEGTFYRNGPGAVLCLRGCGGGRRSMRCWLVLKKSAHSGV
jgi:hypothetical protein